MNLQVKHLPFCGIIMLKTTLAIFTKKSIEKLNIVNLFTERTVISIWM